MRGDIMKAQRMRTRRMSWREIQEKYPDHWVKLEEADVNPENEMDIRSAIVTRVGKATYKDFQDAMTGKSIEMFTTPDNGKHLSVGALTV